MADYPHLYHFSRGDDCNYVGSSLLPWLNFGSGYIMPSNWVNVDKLDYGGNVVADVLQGLPYPDEHFDYIVAQHSLQMIRFDDLPRALAELRRILKISGTLLTHGSLIFLDS